MEKYSEIKQWLKNADAIIVGASNGLSITEGLHIFADNEAFEMLFSDFKKKYGINSILHGCFFQWPTEEERWAFFSRLTMHYSGSYKGSPTMSALMSLIGNKPYFIVTSNAENHFELAGFDPDRILEIEGSWKELVCANRCSEERMSSWEKLRQMHEMEQNGNVPSHLLPRCNRCGAPMTFPDRPREEAVAGFENFLKKYHNKKLVVLELGIGARNQLIKAPLMRLVQTEEKARYITFNKGELYIPPVILPRSIGVDGNLGDILPQIALG